jgi:ubiquinol-cytochrome c reductase cytochrome c subunit
VTLTPRRDALVVLAVVLGVSAGVVVVLLLAARPARGADDLVARGKELYSVGCVSCHGFDGGGVDVDGGRLRGPSLKASGEATAYYYLSTGRMPLAKSDDQPRRKRPAYSTTDIDALVAYVGSLGNGPKIPSIELQGADLAQGGVLFRASCAPCHSAAGAGGALSYGRAAPNLQQAEPLQIASAVRSGPGEMPVFGSDAIDQRQLSDVVSYVRYLQSPDDRGGVPIGRTGPVPEGFVAWFFGMGAFILLVVWIGTRSPVPRRSAHRRTGQKGNGS